MTWTYSVPRMSPVATGAGFHRHCPMYEQWTRKSTCLFHDNELVEHFVADSTSVLTIHANPVTLTLEKLVISAPSPLPYSSLLRHCSHMPLCSITAAICLAAPSPLPYASLLRHRCHIHLCSVTTPLCLSAPSPLPYVSLLRDRSHMPL